MAIKAGWKNVYWFRGGFPEWREAGFTIESKK
jgi:rhodanese-related sulfurtransferase